MLEEDENEHLIDERIKWSSMVWKKQESHISVADNKARLNLGICTALLAGVAFGITRLTSVFPLFWSVVLLILISLAMIFTGWSIGIILYISIPRVDKIKDNMKEERGIAYFRYISEMYKSPEEMLKVVNQLTKEKILSISIHQIHALAIIADRKMEGVKCSTYFIALSIICVVANYIIITIFYSLDYV